MKNIILLDLSAYPVMLENGYHKILANRLQIENHMINMNFGFKVKRGLYKYSRGLLQIGNALISNGFNVTYIVYEDLSDRDRLFNAVQSADIVGFTATTPTITLAASIAKKIKKINPNIVTVVGGHHVTALPQKTLEEFEPFDYAIRGPGEQALLELIKKIESPVSISNVAFRDNIGVIHFRANEFVSNYYAPAYELLYRPVNEYSHNLRTQNGCPYRCIFCAESSLSSKNIPLEYLKSISTELEYLNKFCSDHTLIHFSDPVFNISKNHTSSVLDRISEFSDKFIYSIDTRMELVTSAFTKAAANAGIKYFRVGAKLLQECILKGGDYKSLLDKFIRASYHIKSSSNVSILHLYWMTGLPGTTHENMTIFASLIEELIVNGHVHIIGNRIYVPYPGTCIFENPKEFGISVLNKKWELYDRRLPPVYNLNTMSGLDIYNQFIKTECLQIEAYKKRNKLLSDWT